MSYTPPPPLIAATQLLLDDARGAYHRLMTGTSVVRIKDQNGEELQYNMASASKLLEYIKSLQDTLDPCLRINAPMRLFF
jgi:hypothetical protein